jgi:fucose 4-O-acetylase-like acetyltransferase
MKQRVEYIDLSKGVCIILVVFYHVCGLLGCSFWLSPFLNSFFLSLFFVLSGLFFNDGGSFRHFLLKKTNGLLVPFFSFYLLGSVLLPNLLHYVFGVHFGTSVGWESLWAFVWPGEYPNIPIWFLWCLFVMNVMFWGVRAVVERFSSSCSLFAMFLLCCAICVSGYGLKDTLGFDVGNVFEAMKAMPYFCLGYAFGVKGGLAKLDGMPVSRKAFVALALLSVTFVVSMFLGSLSNYVSMVAGAAGAFMIIVFSSIVGRLPFVSYLGRYSIILLLTHGMLLRLSAPLCNWISSFSTPYGAVFVIAGVVLLSYAVIIPLSCKFLPRLTAQLPLFRK